MSMWRFQDCIQGEANYIKSNASVPFMGSPPFDDLGFIDRNYYERKHSHDKAKQKI